MQSTHDPKGFEEQPAAGPETLAIDEVSAVQVDDGEEDAAAVEPPPLSLKGETGLRLKLAEDCRTVDDDDEDEEEEEEEEAEAEAKPASPAFFICVTLLSAAFLAYRFYPEILDGYFPPLSLGDMLWRFGPAAVGFIFWLVVCLRRFALPGMTAQLFVAGMWLLNIVLPASLFEPALWPLAKHFYYPLEKIEALLPDIIMSCIHLIALYRLRSQEKKRFGLLALAKAPGSDYYPFLFAYNLFFLAYTVAYLIDQRHDLAMKIYAQYPWILFSLVNIMFWSRVWRGRVHDNGFIRCLIVINLVQMAFEIFKAMRTFGIMQSADIFSIFVNLRRGVEIAAPLLNLIGLQAIGSNLADWRSRVAARRALRAELRTESRAGQE